MNRELPIIEWDGCNLGDVLGYWAPDRTIVGRVWRIILDSGKTLVVTPYQSEHYVADGLHVTPERVTPILRGHDFAELVWDVAAANRQLGDYEGLNNEQQTSVRRYWIRVEIARAKAARDGLREGLSRYGGDKLDRAKRGAGKSPLDRAAYLISDHSKAKPARPWPLSASTGSPSAAESGDPVPNLPT